MTQPERDLIDAHLGNRLEAKDHAVLQELLRRDANARRLLRDLAMVDTKLEQLASDAAAPMNHATSDRTSASPAQGRLLWLNWRPLTAAAAGIVFGMFCTSVVFGFVVQRGFEKKTPLALVQPSFEEAQVPLVNGFPDASARWGGDEARVVMAENGVQPKAGKFMLRLEPAAKGSPRIIYQVLDLTSLPPVADGQMRQIEVAASFAPADASASVRYFIRAFAVAESREELDAAWIDRRDEALSSALIGLDGVPGDQAWQTFGLRVQVPPTARSLVLFLGMRTPDKSQPRAANYLDDVQVSLIEPQPLP